jgi:hypothetical protein
MMDQITRQKRAPLPHWWQPGQSGNPAGRLSVAQRRACLVAKARELAADFGGYDSLTEIEKTMLHHVAELLRRRPNNQAELVKISNLVTRVLRDFMRRHQTNRPPPKDELRDYLAEGQSA